MKKLLVLAFFGAVAAVAGCQSIPRDQTLSQYCSDERRANEDLCKINAEIAANRDGLVQTDRNVVEVRGIATQANTTAQQALTREDAMFCETRKLSRTSVGSCSPGYAVVSCTQTRFTRRAGGPTIMRSIDDQECRFASQALEISVRCCMAGAAAKPVEAVPVRGSAPSRRSMSPRPTS